MLPPPAHLRETHLIGPGCREWVLDRAHVPQLRTARLVWVGHGELRPPYRMIRPYSPYSHVVACFGGRGRVLIDGVEVDWRPGRVLLAPVNVLHAFEVAGRGPWRIAWVFFDDRPGPPVIAGDRARLIEADAGDFVASLQMLTREVAGAREPAQVQALVAVVETQARRLAGTEPVDARLWRLWAQVEGDLAHDWNGRALARTASVSEEHLRRLCQRHFRRSPMAHLAQLRMRRACTLLRSTSAKLEVIAQQVGFSSIYAFSGAFKRWSGVPPSEFRLGAAAMEQRTARPR
ncbi:MAG: AraC family transcriptional regulator [Opitutaceae bacterium]